MQIIFVFPSPLRPNNEMSVTIRMGLAGAAQPRLERKNDSSSSSSGSERTIKLPPNAVCHCGSGKKFKKCCGDPSIMNDDYDDLSD